MPELRGQRSAGGGGLLSEELLGGFLELAEGRRQNVSQVRSTETDKC